MKKNILLIIIVVVLVIVLGLGTYFIIQNKNEKNINSDLGNNNLNNGSEKILVVYYSAQNHTENIAKKIANNLNADIFEVEPKNEYTSEDLNYNNSSSRVSREHNDESLRNIELKTTSVNNWEEYDTILIGYPIWWGVAAWPINNFVKDNDFTGKIVIPFCTSASSGIGQSDTLLKELTNTGNWMNGHRFSSSASDSVIKEFTDSIK